MEYKLTPVEIVINDVPMIAHIRLYDDGTYDVVKVSNDDGYYVGDFASDEIRELIDQARSV